ncbi:unnamed protein product [Arctogadus glacialis]
MRTLLLNIITMNVILIKASPQHQVDQTPAAVLEEQNSRGVNLSCEHQIPNYDTILWYRRSQGSNQLDLIAYVYYKQPTIETSFEGNFSVDGDGEKWSRLELLKPRSPEDTGEYYCAARMHCDEEPTYAATKTLELPQERDFVESTATSPPHLSLMLLHPRHLFHHPRHPFQEESAREQARHEESEAKLAEWWRRCDSPPFSQKLRESVCVCVFLGVRVCVFLDVCVCIFRCVVQCFLFK